MPEHEHRRREDINGNVLHERASDRDKVAKYNAFWDRYARFLIPFLWGAAIWAFTQLYPAVKGYPDILSRLDTAETDRDGINAAVKILIKMQCLSLDAIDRTKIDLDCSQIPLPTTAELRSIK